MTLHDTTFEYLKPTDEQVASMMTVRHAAQQYQQLLDMHVPEGPDKTYMMRHLREVAMWANIAITRNADGSPRS